MTTTRAWLPGAWGLGGVLIAWELLARLVFADNRAVPPPSGILSQLGADGVAFYWPNTVTTVREAATGWLYGNAIAIGLAPQRDCGL